ncbi:MAG: glycosyltransferase family 4 protein [Gammaproteobacteria bacterium]|nr:glycosyltransferase family 4 protein [Gammaproteobacteria bacterium]
MRIAYLCADPGIPVFGCKGASLHLQEIIRSFLKLGMDVTLFASHQGGEAPADLQQVKCITLPSRKSSLGKANRAQREVDAMQSHDWFMDRLLQEKAFDLIYERYSLWSQVGVECAEKQGVSAVLEVNAPLIEESKTYRGLVHERQAVSIAQYNFKHASLVCCVSQAVADYVHEFVMAISTSPATRPIIVTPNAVNPQRFSSLSSPVLRAVTDELTIGFVGTLKPWHGLEYLLSAFADFCQKNLELSVSLLIVGEGPQRAAMETLASELKISNKIQFTGAVSPADIPFWLEKMDIAVAPYPALDNFYFSPLKVFEYMAAGLPVIASDIGQIKTIIQHEQQGLLVTPGSASALSKALQQLVDHPQQALQLGYQAQQYIFAHYTWDAVAQRILEQVSEIDTQPRRASQAAGTAN